METLYHKPMEIESRSMAIIEENLTGVEIPEPERSILKRVIHTTADFDYVENLCFSRDAVSSAKKALQNGAHIVTDTNMALSGINKRSLHQLGCQAHCFMSDPDVAAAAKARGVTRAMVSMEKACCLDGDLIFAVGNAPTALIQLDELIRAGKLLPKLIIGVPVGFVNVVEAKELILAQEQERRQQCGGGDLQRIAVSAVPVNLNKTYKLNRFCKAVLERAAFFAKRLAN